MHYRVEAKAKCRSSRGHNGPKDSIAACTCGFYALKARWLLGQMSGCYGDWAKAYQKAAVCLEVNLYGEVVGGHYGYRAQRQRVMGIQVPRKCAVSNDRGRLCRRPTTGLKQGGELMVPACAGHAELSLTEARNQFQTELLVAA